MINAKEQKNEANNLRREAQNQMNEAN